MSVPLELSSLPRDHQALDTREKQLICPVGREVCTEPVVMRPGQHNRWRKGANDLDQGSGGGVGIEAWREGKSGECQEGVAAAQCDYLGLQPEWPCELMCYADPAYRQISPVKAVVSLALPPSFPARPRDTFPSCHSLKQTRVHTSLLPSTPARSCRV